MRKSNRFVGLDVHANSISAAVAEANGEMRFVGKIPNRIDSIRKLMKKLGQKKDLRVCYEAPKSSCPDSPNIATKSLPTSWPIVTPPWC